MDHTGPLSVEPLAFALGVPFEKGYPTVDDCYNTAMAYKLRCQFPNGVEMIIRHDTDNGVLVEGEKGRIFVDRGRLVGKPVQQLKKDSISEAFLTQLRKGKPALGQQDNPWNCHMAHFVACLKDRSTPISDVFTHHRSLTTCHLANIAIRLGRKLTWNPETQQIVGDDEANSFLSRPQRKGYEISA